MPIFDSRLSASTTLVYSISSHLILKQNTTVGKMLAFKKTIASTKHCIPSLVFSPSLSIDVKILSDPFLAVISNLPVLLSGLYWPLKGNLCSDGTWRFANDGRSLNCGHDSGLLSKHLYLSQALIVMFPVKYNKSIKVSTD